VHNSWSVCSPDDKLLFLEMQRLFSEQRFEPGGISLEQTDLSFYPGFLLVRATINPQVVEFKDGKKVEIKQSVQSLFLYNPNTADLARKIIPLSREARSIYMINNHLRLRLTIGTVIDYIKFFGLVVQEEPFFFITSVNEIPWDTKTDGDDKARLLGAINAFCKTDEKGQLETNIKEVNTLWGTHLFRVTLPCIYTDSCYASTLSVSQKGYIKMTEDKALSEHGLTSVRSPLPYYAVNPTKQFERYLNTRMTLAFGYMAALLALLFACQIVEVALGLCIVAELVLRVAQPTLSDGFDRWFFHHPRLLGITLGAASFILVLRAAQVLYVEIAELIGKHQPGLSWMVIYNVREQLQTKFSSFKSRLAGAATRFGWGLSEQLLMWAWIMFSAQSLGYILFSDPRPGTVGWALVSGIERIVGTATFGLVSLSRHLPPPYSSTPTLSGKLLFIALDVCVGTLLVRSILQFWRLSRREEDD
jgi:hypothetical protein